MSRLCGLYMLTMKDSECGIKLKHTWSCIRYLGSGISLCSLILSVFSLDTCVQTSSYYSSIIYKYNFILFFKFINLYKHVFYSVCFLFTQDGKLSPTVGV
jgi:hypothetical protein